MKRQFSPSDLIQWLPLLSKCSLKFTFYKNWFKCQVRVPTANGTAVIWTLILLSSYSPMKPLLSLYSLARTLFMFIAKRQSRWPVFGSGHKPLRTEVCGDTLISFFAQRPIYQSSLTIPARLIDSSMRGGKGKSQQSKGKKRKKDKWQKKQRSRG